MKVSVNDLSRDELLLIVRRHILFVSARDIAFVRWEVASNKALSLSAQSVEISGILVELLRQFNAAKTPQAKAKAWSKYLRTQADQDRLEARYRRAEKAADRLYASISGAKYA